MSYPTYNYLVSMYLVVLVLLHLTTIDTVQASARSPAERVLALIKPAPAPSGGTTAESIHTLQSRPSFSTACATGLVRLYQSEGPLFKATQKALEGKTACYQCSRTKYDTPDCEGDPEVKHICQSVDGHFCAFIFENRYDVHRGYLCLPKECDNPDDIEYLRNSLAPSDPSCSLSVDCTDPGDTANSRHGGNPRIGTLLGTTAGICIGVGLIAAVITVFAKRHRDKLYGSHGYVQQEE